MQTACNLDARSPELYPNDSTHRILEPALDGEPRLNAWGALSIHHVTLAAANVAVAKVLEDAQRVTQRGITQCLPNNRAACQEKQAGKII